jgi:hypothetical protein
MVTVSLRRSFISVNPTVVTVYNAGAHLALRVGRQLAGRVAA